MLLLIFLFTIPTENTKIFLLSVLSSFSYKQSQPKIDELSSFTSHIVYTLHKVHKPYKTDVYVSVPLAWNTRYKNEPVYGITGCLCSPSIGPLALWDWCQQVAMRPGNMWRGKAAGRLFCWRLFCLLQLLPQLLSAYITYIHHMQSIVNFSLSYCFSFTGIAKLRFLVNSCR